MYLLCVDGCVPHQSVLAASTSVCAPQVHLRSKPHVPDLDFEAITRQTHDYSGAMLANLTDSAAVLVALDGRDIITTQDMLNVRAGPCQLCFSSSGSHGQACANDSPHFTACVPAFVYSRVALRNAVWRTHKSCMARIHL